ncbi:hemagglutinin repeat-containing protein [Moraxella cuniculi]|uniref:Filamentous hemagglutinin n=1 Tax=Moraxella cuniculi TaxID=34061 RepID=A0A448GVZ7_9GAMM|nr:hemagglutinin repeat-containing protein [Moraxella cuniculi]VEG12937.1 Uncharacterised protein [Moraxella cuniculi]
MDSNTSIQSTVGGKTVLMKADNGISIMGSDVIADYDTTLLSDGAIRIGSATNTLNSQSQILTKKSGLFSTSPTSATLGKQRTQDDTTTKQTTYTGSTIAALDGSVTLISGNSLHVTNSDVIAQTKNSTNTASDKQTGNIFIEATDVTIESQNAINETSNHFTQKTTGVTASVSSSLVSDIQSIESLKDATEDTNSRRMQLMGGLAAVSKSYTLTKNLKNKNFGSIRAQATVGSQSTKSNSQSHQETNDAANIHADGNLIFDVKGKGDDSTLTVTGSNISVGKDLYNLVEGDVTYQASTQTSTSDSQNSSKGWGVGVYASANLGTDGLSSNSAGFTANANKAKGSSTEQTTTHTNTQIKVGGTTYNDIKGNLILDGANLSTQHLTGTVAKDLIISSRQDQYQYTYNQKQAGFSADVGFDGKPQNLSVNGGKTNIDISYAQVTNQSGIKANQSTLSVQGQGSFTGGYLITDQGKNQTQFAQGINTQNIENHLTINGKALQTGINISQNGISPTDLGYGTITPTNKTSTTHSAITDQAGLDYINTENFNQQQTQNQLNQIINNDFNKDKAIKELNAQTVITTEFGKQAPKTIGDYAQAKQIELTAQGNQEEANKWAEDGIYRIALHTLTGVLATGTIKGAVSAGTTAYTIPKIDEYLTKQGFDETTRQTALLALSAGIGATVGGDTASTVNNVGQTRWNYLNHWENAKLKELKAKKQKLSNAYGYCISSECAEISKQITELEKLSKQRDKEFDTAYANCRAGIDCNQFYYLHVTQRNEWNREGVELFKKQFNPKLSYEQQSQEFRQNWNEYPDYKNAFHNFSADGTKILQNPDGAYPHAKYVHKGGQFEVIVDKKTGKIVTVPSNAGTFNYYADSLGHIDYDVDPWADFGSGNGDNTSYDIRHSGSGKFFGEFKLWDNKEDSIKKFKKVDKVR